MTRHLELEIVAVKWRGSPLEPGEPVPGCGCDWCLADPRPPSLAAVTASITARGLASGLVTADDIESMPEVVDIWARQLAAGAIPSTVDPPRRSAPARSARNAPDRHDQRPALDVDAARAANIIDVAAQLGLEVNRAGWACCPFHDDRHPSLLVKLADQLERGG